jgi:hypothetical protein
VRGNLPIASAVRRACAFDHLPGGELGTRLEGILTVVRLTASGPVNCANVSTRTAIVQLPCANHGRKLHAEDRSIGWLIYDEGGDRLATTVSAETGRGETRSACVQILAPDYSNSSCLITTHESVSVRVVVTGEFIQLTALAVRTFLASFRMIWW